MRLSRLAPLAIVLCTSTPALAQSWEEYSNRDDRFTVNVAGQPQVRDITWPSEYGMTFPGRVFAFQPAEFIAFKKQYGDDQTAVDAAYANVDAVAGPFAAPAFAVPLDTIVTVQNFHDLYLKPFPAGTGDKASAALFAALKPGGTLVVVDHSAADGSGTTLSDSLHRIDKAAVVAALTKAGFKLEAESDLYKRADDPRTANVFDAGIRGKTDQFALRFRKPG